VQQDGSEGSAPQIGILSSWPVDDVANDEATEAARMKALALVLVLPPVALFYAVGLWLLRSRRLIFWTKVVGFLAAWVVAGLVALLAGPGATAWGAIETVIPSGLTGALVALVVVAIMGRRGSTTFSKGSPNLPQTGSLVSSIATWVASARETVRRWSSEKVVIASVAAAIMMTLLFPPFVLDLNGLRMNLGYGFLFDPPMLQSSVAGAANVPMLFAEWTAIVLVALLAWALIRIRSK
jgi:hypothetical protein